MKFINSLDEFYEFRSKFWVRKSKIIFYFCFLIPNEFLKILWKKYFVLSSAMKILPISKSSILSNEESFDIETLLSLPSSKERESKKLTEEILQLLNHPTAKEQALVEAFRSLFILWNWIFFNFKLDWKVKLCNFATLGPTKGRGSKNFAVTEREKIAQKCRPTAEIANVCISGELFKNIPTSRSGIVPF